MRSKNNDEKRTFASLGGGLLFDDEASHAGDDELASLGELTLTDGGQGLEASAGHLFVETGLGAEVVHELGLGEVLALGLDGLDDGLGLGGLGGLLGMRIAKNGCRTS